jgi:hypothetical protein
MNPEGELEPYNGLAEEYPKNHVFYGLNDFQEFVQGSVEKYYNISYNSN